MRIGLLGTGMVGQTLGRKLVSLDHEVRMGSRQAGNEKAVAWVETAGVGASEGSFADAAEFGELVINATGGSVTMDVLAAAGVHNLAGKVLVDVSNPLDASGGMPPILSVSNTDSVGEQIQRAYPDVKVVKTLNTVNCEVMVTPSLAGESHTMFLCGNDDGAKAEVRRLLESFGWPPSDLLDLGDISSARGMEMYVTLWVRLWMATGTGHLNVKLVTGP